MTWFAALGVGWAVLLVGHWVLLPEPTWLAVAHTLAFTLTSGYWLFATLFVLSMQRRRPDLFGED